MDPANQPDGKFPRTQNRLSADVGFYSVVIVVKHLNTKRSD